MRVDTTVGHSAERTAPASKWNVENKQRVKKGGKSKVRDFYPKLFSLLGSNRCLQKQQNIKKGHAHAPIREATIMDDDWEYFDTALPAIYIASIVISIVVICMCCALCNNTACCAPCRRCCFAIPKGGRAEVSLVFT